MTYSRKQDTETNFSNVYVPHYKLQIEKFTKTGGNFCIWLSSTVMIRGRGLVANDYQFLR